MSKHRPLILVTGAKGQLGTTLQALANKESHFQWVFCDKDTLDLCQPKSVEAQFRQYSPDYCINTAAYTNVAQAEENPSQAKAVNVTGVKHLIDACNQAGCCLIQMSTDYVFDGQQSHPYMESDPVNPLNVYGRTKAESEQLVTSQANAFYVVRTAWLYAINHGQNFYRTILKKAQAGESLSVVNDQMGTPTSTDQLANFLLQLIKTAPPQGLYHCAGKDVLSWYAFAKKILKTHQLEVPLHPNKSHKSGVQRPSFSALGTEKTIS